MGVQLPTHRSHGAMQKAKQKKKTAEGRVRYLGHWLEGDQRTRIMFSGETSGYKIERKAPKGHDGTIHLIEDREPAGEFVQRATAGSAFSWWANQTPAERERTIAGIVAANEPAQERGKQGAACSKQVIHKRIRV